MQSEAKTTEVEARVALICACTDDGRPLTGDLPQEGNFGKPTTLPSPATKIIACIKRTIMLRADIMCVMASVK